MMENKIILACFALAVCFVYLTTEAECAEIGSGLIVANSLRMRRQTSDAIGDDGLRGPPSTGSPGSKKTAKGGKDDKGKKKKKEKNPKPSDKPSDKPSGDEPSGLDKEEDEKEEGKPNPDNKDKELDEAIKMQTSARHATFKYLDFVKTHKSPQIIENLLSFYRMLRQKMRETLGVTRRPIGWPPIVTIRPTRHSYLRSKLD